MLQELGRAESSSSFDEDEFEGSIPMFGEIQTAGSKIAEEGDLLSELVRVNRKALANKAKNKRVDQQMKKIQF